MQGAQEATLSADADLATTTIRQAWSRPPIELDFSGELIFFSYSRLRRASWFQGIELTGQWSCLQHLDCWCGI